MELIVDNQKEVKKTELGTFPKDWRLVPIKELAKISTGDKNTEDKVSDGKYPFFVRSANVERINTYSFDGEAVLTAGDGVGTGKIFHYINGKFDYHQRVYKMSDFSSEVIGFYFYLCFSNYFYDRVMGMTAKSSVDSVRMDMIADMKIPLPPTLEEQQAIATALSDVDELIHSLDGLIQKKQAIKKGTMQQLLTGKKRLPGLDGEWEVKRLEEFADIQRGASPRPISDPKWFSEKKNIGWVRISDIKGKYLYKTRDYLSDEGMKRSRFLEKGSLIMSIAATVGLPVITRMDLCIHDGFVGFWNLRNIDQEYLYYKLKFYRSELEEEGQIGSQSNINSEIVRNFKKKFPALEEQKAIAKVLSDMDRELQTLRQKREKYVQIKQGMMQELLTGKVRLV